MCCFWLCWPVSSTFTKSGAQTNVTKSRVRAGRLLHLKEDAVSALTVHRGDTTIVMRKSGGTWRILQPVAAGGDRGEIAGLIRTLRFMDLERVVADSVRIARGEARLSDFGLDRPNLALVITQADRVDSLFWGDRSPTGRYGYVRWSGHPGVLAVGAPFRLRLEKGLFQLRDKRVAHFNPESLRKVEMALGHARIVVEMISDEWRLTFPVNDRTDDDEVRKLINRLRTAEFTRVVEEESGERGQYGLEKPTLTVTVYDGDHERKKTIVIGRREGRWPVSAVFCGIFGQSHGFSGRLDLCRGYQERGQGPEIQAYLRFRRLWSRQVEAGVSGPRRGMCQG